LLRNSPGSRTTAYAISVVVVVVATSMPLVSGVQTDERLQALIRSAASGSGDEHESSGLMVHDVGERWYQPLAVYPVASLLRLGVPPTLADRLPAALAAGLAVVFTLLVALHVTGSAGLAAGSVVLLLVSPGFRSSSMTGGADLLLVPLVLVWLVCVLEDVVAPRWWLPLVGGLMLGLSLYTQPAGVLSVPIFFALGAALRWRQRRSLAFIVISAGAVTLIVAPAALWIVRHPEAYADTFGRWAIHAAHLRNPFDGVIAFSRWHVIARRVGEYWLYFDPTFLFSREMYGLAFAALVPFGLWHVRHRPRAARVVVIGGVLLTPVAAVLLDVPRQAGFVVMFLPFGALLGALGLEALHELTRREK
jgi:hypothetical protein